MSHIFTFRDNSIDYPLNVYNSRYQVMHSECMYKENQLFPYKE